MSTKLVLITGLSGSGKSTVAKCFEDLGYHCVDNLPLPLLETFLEKPVELVPGKRRLAVVADVRAPGFAEHYRRLIERFDELEEIEKTLLFLEASEEALIRRFSETRRPHPLDESGAVVDAIRQERKVLDELRARADLVLDTSSSTVHETRDAIYRTFASEPGEVPKPVLSFFSFGFKHGGPQAADMVFDVRFLPNPHFEPGLRELTGRDQPVRDFLEAIPEYHETLQRFLDLIRFLAPRFQRENRSYLTVAIGCTGGQHRSVAIAEALAKHVDTPDWIVRVSHRDARSLVP